MLGGGDIVSTAIFSRIMLKRRIERHHFLGCFFSFFGFFIVGFSAFLSSQEEIEGFELDKVILGLIFKVIELILLGIQNNVREIILREKGINVQRMIGVEGIYGLVWSFCLCLAFNFVKCPSNDICTVSYLSL